MALWYGVLVEEILLITSIRLLLQETVAVASVKFSCDCGDCGVVLMKTKQKL